MNEKVPTIKMSNQEEIAIWKRRGFKRRCKSLDDITPTATEDAVPLLELEKYRQETPLPKVQMAILLICLLADSLSITVVFPLSPFLIQHFFHFDEAEYVTYIGVSVHRVTFVGQERENRSLCWATGGLIFDRTDHWITRVGVCQR